MLSQQYGRALDGYSLIIADFLCWVNYQLVIYGHLAGFDKPLGICARQVCGVANIFIKAQD